MKQKKKKIWTNEEVAKLLKAIAAAYQVKNEGANKFKIMAYDRAATAIEHLTSEVKDLWDDGQLKQIPSIGPSIAQHLDELFSTGKVKHFEKILAGLPKAMFELMQIKGLGPKTTFKLCQVLGIRKRKNAIHRLKEAAKDGEIRQIPGFGEESEKKILRAIEQFERIGKKKKRMLLVKADFVSQQLLSYLRQNPLVLRADPLGSLRRRCATVGDIDIAVATHKPQEVIAWIKKYPKIKEILTAGKRLISFLLTSGYQIDIRLHRPAAYGSLLQHFTGSKQHNIHLRELALKMGFSLSEYGIKELKDKKKRRKLFREEKEFYQFLGLSWIPPELREDAGEIEAATQKKLPNLISFTDIKGDLHIHSDFHVETSHDEGADSMETIVKRASQLNYQYLAFSEHNPSRSKHSQEEIITIIKGKKDYIEQKKYSWIKKFNIYVFNSLEIDIRPDGSLALPEKALEYLDFVIVSVHAAFNLSKKQMTQRILKALEHPKVKILGHPTGRLLNEREGYEIDWEKIFAFCQRNNKFLEINAYPNRLDLPDILVREAIKSKVKLVINTDAHAVSQLDYLKYGVDVARKGWAEAKNIINTLPLEEFAQLMGAKM